MKCSYIHLVSSLGVLCFTFSYCAVMRLQVLFGIDIVLVLSPDFSTSTFRKKREVKIIVQ